MSKDGDVLTVDFEYKQLYIRNWRGDRDVDENLDEAEKLFVALSSNFKVPEPAIDGDKKCYPSYYGDMIACSFNYYPEFNEVMNECGGVVCGWDECWYFYTSEFPCFGFVETEAFLISMFQKYFHINPSYCSVYSLTVGIRNFRTEEDRQALKDFIKEMSSYNLIDLSTVSTHVVNGLRQWVKPFAPKVYNWKDTSGGVVPPFSLFKDLRKPDEYLK